MAEEEEVSQDLLLKCLRRIEGQIRGVQKIVSDGRDCESLVIQLAAIRSAVESAGAFLLLAL